MKSLLTVLLLVTAISTALAHVDHEHDTINFDLPGWERHLRAFQETGSGLDLAAAEQIAEKLMAANPTNLQFMYLAAQTAQAGHRFGKARLFLQQLLSVKSEMDQARLMLANIWLVQGNPQQAAAECRKLRKSNVVVVLTCHAQAKTEVQYSDYDTLAAVLRNSEGQLPLQITAWVDAVLADMATRLGSLKIAEQHYQNAYLQSPLIRYRSALVDLHLRLNNFEQAREYISIGSESLGMQVKSLILSRKLGMLDDSDPTLRQLDSVFSTDIENGDYSHGREMAEFYFYVKNDASLARHILQHAFKIQQEPEDLRLLSLVNGVYDS